jgi:cell division septum initiation protein DivIVA
LDWLRSTAKSFAAVIPGADAYVDSAFRDLEVVQAKHGKEAEDIINCAYKELKTVTKGNISAETASRSWKILEKAIKQLCELASDSAQDIMDNHPQLKKEVGGDLDKLKSMADNYGPEAREQLDNTYQQIEDMIKGGVSMESINKVRRMIQEKVEKMSQFGDAAWKKGMEKAKPYLDKDPLVRDIVEKNADSLKRGNHEGLFEMVKEAVSSGNTEQLQEHVKQVTEKDPQMMPSINEIFSTMQRLQEVAKGNGKEAEDTVKTAYQEICKILEKGTREVEALAGKAGRNVRR